ncbi:MAG: 16S rRNA (guanine(966)-N(2))-methyltransferase RsmD [Pseudomonadota bacterium]
MRIVGGAHRGRRIAAPKGDVARPTTDRVREALFNLLEHGQGAALDGARVIDLFAGSGALGFEALSRGAAFVLFVETSAASRGAIRQTIDDWGAFGETRIHRRDACALGTKPAGLGARFDVAFLDPPYGQGLVEPALAALASGAWLSAGATIAVERPSREPETQAARYLLRDARAYGDTRIDILSFDDTTE